MTEEEKREAHKTLLKVIRLGERADRKTAYTIFK